MNKIVYLLFLIAMLIPISVHAQLDTVVVAGDTLLTGGNLNIAIKTAMDAGSLSNKVFKLELNKRYILKDSILVPEGQCLTIVAPEPGITQSTAPPQILCASGFETYNIPFNNMFECYGDLTLKNIWLLNANTHGEQAWTCVIFRNDPLSTARRCTFDNVIIDYSSIPRDAGGSVTVACKNFKGTFKNCYWKNCVDRHFRYYGRALSFPFSSKGWNGDSVLFENCTFANIGYVLMQEQGEYYNYVKFNHCTFYNVIMYPMEAGWWNKLTVTNCIFANTWMYGSVLGASSAWGETEGAIFRIDSLSKTYYDGIYSFPYTEQDRRILCTHSAYYLDQWLVDWMWNCPYSVSRRNSGEFDRIPVPQPMFNTKTLMFFDSVDVHGEKVFPYMNRSNLYNGISVTPTCTVAYGPEYTYPNVSLHAEFNPGFLFPPSDTNTIKIWFGHKWDDGWDGPWAWKPENSFNQIWPLEENLVYANNTLKTAGLGGLPLGDLYRWWPEKYQQWKAQERAENDTINKWLHYGLGDSTSNSELPILVDQWGSTVQGKAWPIKNNSTTPAGDASIGNGARPTGWSTIRGGFDPITITTDKAIIVSGKMELVGGGGESFYTWLRYALTYQDSAKLKYALTDSATWVHTIDTLTPLKHYGYEFCPRSGTGTMSSGSGRSGGSVWTVVNGSWTSNWSNGGKGALLYVKQAPNNAVAIAGTYNWAISVKSINDTLNEVRWYLVEQNNEYWWGGSFIDTATSKKFNGVCFGFNLDMGATQVNFTEVKVDMGASITVPQAPFSYFYVDQWGIIGNRFGGWKFIPTDLDGNASIGGDIANTSCATICGYWAEPVTLREGYKLSVTGKAEFIHGGFEAANSLRIGVFHNSTPGTLVTSPIDSIRWSGSENSHSGYLFIPPSGNSTALNWSLLNQQGTWGAVVNDFWFSTSGVNNYALGSNLQVPAHAIGTEGKYNVTFAIAALTDTTNEVSFSFVKEDSSYSFSVEKYIDRHKPLATQMFNGIAFALDSGNTTTALNLYDMLIEVKTYTVGVDEDKKNVTPNKFMLSQNYPNPFNPVTTISYQLPSNIFVELKIYDLLGREIRSLVNEYQSAGSYSLTFDASNLPSGVYFYRIQSGNFIDAKKLILLK